MSSGTPNPKVFVRDATGLVRQFSWLDAFVISSSVLLASIWGYSLQIVAVIGADPGANIVTSENIGLLFCIPLAIVYAMLATRMGRSGGDYVWTSRTLQPTFGFVISWAFWISILGILGLEAYIFPTAVLPNFLGAFGYSLHNSYLLALASSVAITPNSFLIGIVVMILSTAIIGFGPKLFTRVMLVLFVAVTLSTLLSFVVLAGATHSDFVSAVNGYGGTNISYTGIISQAQSRGWSYVPLTTAVTLASIPISILMYAGFNWSAAVSGEVRTIRKSMLIGIVGALAAGWLIDVVGTQLSVNVVGYQFLQASSSLGSSWPLVAPPWMPIFISMLTKNFPILFLIQLGWILSLFWNLAGNLTVATRYVFAFSFDRTLPTLFADVNERFHFPLKASVLNFAGGIIFLIIATFTSFIGLFLNSVAIWAVMWFSASAAAIILPYKSKQKGIVSGLPGSHWKIPLLTILGIISAASMAVTFYYSVTTPAIGPSTPGADALLAGIYLSGLIVYLARREYLKRRGVRLSMAYSEIPPE